MLGIGHIDQIEPVGRRGQPALGPVGQGKDLGSPLDRPFAAAYLHEHPGNIAHHVMQEGIGADIQHDELAEPLQPQVMDLLDGGLGLTRQRPLGSEVMLANQGLRSDLHALQIERSIVPGHFVGQVRRSHRVIVDYVAIPPGHR